MKRISERLYRARMNYALNESLYNDGMSLYKGVTEYLRSKILNDPDWLDKTFGPEEIRPDGAMAVIFFKRETPVQGYDLFMAFTHLKCSVEQAPEVITSKDLDPYRSKSFFGSTAEWGTKPQEAKRSGTQEWMIPALGPGFEAAYIGCELSDCGTFVMYEATSGEGVENADEILDPYYRSNASTKQKAYMLSNYQGDEFRSMYTRSRTHGYNGFDDDSEDDDDDID